jgi:hypothetical protein
VQDLRDADHKVPRHVFGKEPAPDFELVQQSRRHIEQEFVLVCDIGGWLKGKSEGFLRCNE